MHFIGNLYTFFIERRGEILAQTIEHIWITFLSLTIAATVGISLGIFLTRQRKLAHSVLGIVSIIQTIPSLALLGFLLPIFGIGVTPAIIALFLYALLPIVRNTYTGIQEVEASVLEAARGMGMSGRQILTKVELPLATPTIFAGIRTAVVINIGIATLCAFIAAGGLGEFIFRGIALNNVTMIMAGAIPASLLALFFDALLGILQRYIRYIVKPVVAGFSLILILMLGYSAIEMKEARLMAGFNSEFMEREDGYPGLKSAYILDGLEVVEMEISLMYQALNNGKVDVISGFSTDGRIDAYNLRVLKDDKQYFPPYYAAPLIRGETLRRYPQLSKVFENIAGKISEETMRRLNYSVDTGETTPQAAAKGFLENLGIKVLPKKTDKPDIVIGSKNFTENFILAEMFAMLIESESGLTVELKQGFGGTKLLFEAMQSGGVDLYPEYTGTGLLVLIQPEKEVTQVLGGDPEKVYEYVKQVSKEKFDLVWLQPLGFNNTTALMMQKAEAEHLKINTISDLQKYLGQE